MKKQEHQQAIVKRDTILTCRTFKDVREKLDRAAGQKKLTRNQYLETIIVKALENEKAELALN